MEIRQETPHDYQAVYTLVMRAFATADHADGTEADYLNALRHKPGFIPQLSLVAQQEGVIVGQITLYEMSIQCPDQTLTELVLSPLSVDPSHFRRGIASALIAEGCRRAETMGYHAVFLCGDPSFYTKFGFSPTNLQGIYHVRDRDRQADWCMVKQLCPGYLDGVQGVIDIE